MNELAWKRLLGHINDGLVVPVLGSQLLVDPSTGRSMQSLIADVVAQQCGLAPDTAVNTTDLWLSDLINRLKRESKVRLQELYELIHVALGELTAPKSSIPKPIRQIAEIPNFRLLVTATPDDMLARCLRERCSVREIIHSPNLSQAAGSNDLPTDWQSRESEVYLLYLFGKSQRTPVFAIHEEDVLEYAHNMIARGSNVPTAFLGELQARNLLFIGCRFPDWLSRFFLRVTNKDRLSRERSKREWLIEQLKPSESLTLFLECYSKDTEILSQMEPADFVAELHRRWMAEHGGEADQSPKSEAGAPPRGAMFFVSYSRCTDHARAETVVQTLLKLGVSKEEVWFDRTNVDPGHDFRQRILNGIDSCRYFIPLLSESANDREEAFVFIEWRKANERLEGMNREFVMPVIVDADYRPERYSLSQAPDWPVRLWKDRLDFGHAPGGVPDERTMARLKGLIREARRERGAA